MRSDDGGTGGPRRGRTPSVRAALALLVGVGVLYVVAGIPLQLVLGEAGLALAQLTLLGLPVLVFVAARRYDVVETLSMRRPTGRAVRGAVLLMAGGVPLAWYLAWLQSFVIPVPVEVLEAMRAFLATDDPLRILWLLVLVAAIPAVCEELLFRGALLSGLRSALPVGGAVVVSGVIFGLFHLSPQTAFRFLPTAWLGILLAWIVVESRSLLLAMGLHFVNNAAILLITVMPVTRDLASDPDRPPPIVLLPVALVLFGLGARTLGVRPARPAMEQPG